MPEYVPATVLNEQRPIHCHDCGHLIWKPRTVARIFQDEARGDAERCPSCGGRLAKECLICPACGLLHYAEIGDGDIGAFDYATRRGTIRFTRRGTAVGGVEILDEVECANSMTVYAVHRRQGSDTWHVTDLGEDKRSIIPVAEYPSVLEALACALRLCDEHDAWMFELDEPAESN